jgi:hypothetical protein
VTIPIFHEHFFLYWPLKNLSFSRSWISPLLFSPYILWVILSTPLPTLKLPQISPEQETHWDV